jgi:uncharacterized protein with ParB-like and HNH nuclease domain
MKHHIFYGDYSLKHWIELILKGRIIIPEFQRRFVWKKEDVKHLVESFNSGSFVPPIMIGAYSGGNGLEDHLIDGQQRLSSILLAYLGKFPNRSKHKAPVEEIYADINDDTEDEEEDSLDWTFKKIQAFECAKKMDKDEIKSKLDKSLYDEFVLDLPEDFFENNRLGFSYIKGDEKDSGEQKGFYAQLFRSINTGGLSLTTVETREALYWLGGSDLKEFFKPDFAKKVRIDKGQLDFARILALLNEYKKIRNFDEIAKGYSGKENFEKFVVFYISSVIRKEFNIDGYRNRVSKIENYLRKKIYYSIIDADYELFGLVYFVLFENKEIDISKEEELRKEIDNTINNKSEKEKRTPAALKYLRERIKKSIEIYRKYTKEVNNV